MLTLITGGSGSGKSEFAENLAVSYQRESLVYIATMFPFDEECRKRIVRHQSMRAQKHFTTIECFTGLHKIEWSNNSIVLLECMSNLVANEMYQENGAKENTVEMILKGITLLRERAEHVIIVSNEVFSDGAEYDAETKRYLDYLGEINCEIGKIADEVIEIVYTIPRYLKNAPQDAHDAT